MLDRFGDCEFVIVLEVFSIFFPFVDFSCYVGEIHPMKIWA